MAAPDITLSVVSHGQNALVNQLLEDIQRHCADRVAPKERQCSSAQSLSSRLDMVSSRAKGTGTTSGTAQLIFSPLMRFLKFYLLRLGFLDGLPGLVHISIGCMNSFMKYAKLIEIRRMEEK